MKNNSMLLAKAAMKAYCLKREHLNLNGEQNQQYKLANQHYQGLMRKIEGDPVARRMLETMKANEARHDRRVKLIDQHTVLGATLAALGEINPHTGKAWPGYKPMDHAEDDPVVEACLSRLLRSIRNANDRPTAYNAIYDMLSLVREDLASTDIVEFPTTPDEQVH